MLVLGLYGTPAVRYPSFRGYNSVWGVVHDAAAALVRNGEVLAAVEEERLSRVKHTSELPMRAARFCLEHAGVGLDDLDAVAVGSQFLAGDRDAIVAALVETFGRPLDPGRLVFVEHHLAHAFGALTLSGFDETLVLSLDGLGDDLSGLVLEAGPDGLDVLEQFSVDESLGLFYLRGTRQLGFDAYDEYKVMGLAPYGDASRFRDAFRTVYELLPDGAYRIYQNHLDRLKVLLPARASEADLSQEHRDYAAALQGAFEELFFHVVRHWKAKTSARRLCLTGGVAHNCVATGKLLHSGLFEELFIHPAADDSGVALGAALHAAWDGEGTRGSGAIQHVFWGPAIPGGALLEKELSRWRAFVSFEAQDDVCASAAALLAEGNVLGWVQGRSEFGPRALGNRSIVADPRPAENREIINAYVKKREAFRPFAPSVVAEAAAQFFELPAGDGPHHLPFMNFVVPVRDEHRKQLAAITHVDGSARIQTVSRDGNERYWRLLRAFGELTGVPILLNTSFNHRVEPIVDSVDDAVVCLLTTALPMMIVGDFVVTKHAVTPESYLALVPRLPAHITLATVRSCAGERRSRLIDNSGRPADRASHELSDPAYRLLSEADGRASLGTLMRRCNITTSEGLVAELVELWSRRVVTLVPG